MFVRRYQPWEWLRSHYIESVVGAEAFHYEDFLTKRDLVINLRLLERTHVDKFSVDLKVKVDLLFVQ